MCSIIVSKCLANIGRCVNLIVGMRCERSRAGRQRWWWWWVAAVGFAAASPTAARLFHALVCTGILLLAPQRSAATTALCDEEVEHIEVEVEQVHLVSRGLTLYRKFMCHCFIQCWRWRCGWFRWNLSSVRIARSSTSAKSCIQLGCLISSEFEGGWAFVQSARASA